MRRVPAHRLLRAVRPLALALLLVPAGCGTLMNFGREHVVPRSARIYGGVGKDLVAVTLPFRTSLPGQSFLLRLAHVPMGLLDLPFSIVADTVTLYWTIGYALSGPEEQRETTVGGFGVR